MENNELRLEAKDLNQQGATLLKAGNFDSAQTKFQKAIEIDPMLGESYKNYGDLHMAKKEYGDAKNMYKRALLIEKSGELYFLYGNACFMNDNVYEGLENYNLALSEGYDNDEMMFFMGMAYEHLNDNNMALRYFCKASTKNPTRPEYQVKMITAQIKQGLLDKADESIEELLKSSPEIYDGYHLKTQLLLHKGQIEKALKFSKQASERFPEDAELMFDYVKSVAMSKDLEKAATLLKIAGKMKYYKNMEREFLHLEAQILAEQGRVDDAMEKCRECVALEGEGQFDSEVRFMLMNLYLIKPDYENALTCARVIVDNNAEDSYYYAALYYKPFCMAQMGKAEEAKAFYTEANAIYRLATIEKPGAIEIYLYRIMCLKDLEQYDKALELLEFLEGISGEIVEVYTMRDNIYRAMGENTLARREMKKAYKLRPDLKLIYGEDDG